MGNKAAPTLQQKEDLIQQMLATIVFQNNNRLNPMVDVENLYFDGFCAPWQDALVVKLLGKIIGYHVMMDRLNKNWKLTTSFDMLDIGNNFYMVKFDIEADRTKVMEEGPQMIFDHYLTIHTWSQDFISTATKIDETLVWVRFPGLDLLL